MPPRAAITIYSYRINDYSLPSGWSTANLFDVAYLESDQSPIETFYDKLKELNILTLDPRRFKAVVQRLQDDGKLSANLFTELNNAVINTASIPTVLANLILLGYISAVESYFREIIRKVIGIDAEARKACEHRAIAFGAALFQKKEMLPEALLENISFIKKKDIEDVLKDFIGIKKVPFSQNIIDTLTEFEAVCQLRHCIVHRFGKLGSNNAIKLGLDSHGAFIEKPIKLDYNSLQNVGAVCSNVVKEVNQFLWEYIMMRLIAETDNGQTWKKKTNPIIWTWDFRKDKKLFKRYFETFALRNSAAVVVDIRNSYNDYKTKFLSLP